MSNSIGKVEHLCICHFPTLSQFIVGVCDKCWDEGVELENEAMYG